MELFHYFNLYIAVSLYDPWLQDTTDEVMFSHIQVKESDKQSESLPENFESGNTISITFLHCANTYFFRFAILHPQPPHHKY